MRKNADFLPEKDGTFSERVKAPYTGITHEKSKAPFESDIKRGLFIEKIDRSHRRKNLPSRLVHQKDGCVFSRIHLSKKRICSDV